jgi:hypothetical protein
VLVPNLVVRFGRRWRRAAPEPGEVRPIQRPATVDTRRKE